VKTLQASLFLFGCIPAGMTAKAPKPGFSGELSIVALHAAKSSHLSPKDDRTLETLFDSAATKSTNIVAPLGKVAYTLDPEKQQQLYIGTSRDDIAVGTLAFEIGYQQALESGTVLNLSVLPTLISGEAWQNPYLLGSPRKTSNISGMAYRIKLSSLAGTGLSLDAAYANSHIEKERITDSDLTRDADAYHFKMLYRQPLSRSLLLMPAINMVDYNATGKAASYKAYKANLSAFYFTKPHKLALTLGVAFQDFDKGASTFNNKVRSDIEWQAFLAYEYAQPFDWKDWSLIGFCRYSNLNSNIGFYDETSFLISVGMNHRF
jgi:hypothetical protein